MYEALFKVEEPNSETGPLMNLLKVEQRQVKQQVRWKSRLNRLSTTNHNANNKKEIQQVTEVQEERKKRRNRETRRTN